MCVESGLGPWMEWTERYPSHAYGKTVLCPEENKESYASCIRNCAHPFVSRNHEMTWLSVAVPAPQAPPSVRIALPARKPAPAKDVR